MAWFLLPVWTGDGGNDGLDDADIVPDAIILSQSRCIIYHDLKGVPPDSCGRTVSDPAGRLEIIQ
jgi:hypothetical protein